MPKFRCNTCKSEYYSANEENLEPCERCGSPLSIIVDCNNCANMKLTGCETMIEPFSDYSCFMTKNLRLKTERDIVEYAVKYSNIQNEYVAKKKLKEMEG